MLGTIIKSITVFEKKMPGLALDIYIKHACCVVVSELKLWKPGNSLLQSCLTF